MKVVVLGCGTMGYVHAAAFSRMPGVTLVAVCDIDGERAERVASSLETAYYTSFEEMMDAVDADVVSVALPTPFHKEYVLKVAALGKHVICEKPIAPAAEDADEMIAACRAKGVRLFVGHVVRFFPEYVDLSKRIGSGAIGTVGVAHAKRIGSHPGEHSPWYADKEASGGVIMDLMIHDIDYMRSLFGDVKSVYALNRTEPSVDYALVTLRFHNHSAIVHLEAHWGYPGAFTTAVDFAGTSGVLQYDSSATKSLQVRRTEAAAAEKSVQVPQSPSYRDPYFIELAHFIDCIRSGAEPIVSAEDAKKAVEVARAAMESATTGQLIRLQSTTGEAR
ncbi:Gfo/Idh/MocA family protein [Paenibacillus lignilyticus]|uniref:Gfo/Idh/MocA family oxidoreductase n=1 Tax=Paenibacillus lignilyticus TaxID=1172615 RepID=A0ABS5CHE6_9BACL|nr:Gfo/Idh/MocA family oxidoreductase [Paenibacillus lignilyticus]MBP3965310.1 Gfo/Idh/MocA family oxidoreductase [Paenibacillus lignilyticus]